MIRSASLAFGFILLYSPWAVAQAPLTDADEVQAGKLLAAQWLKQEGVTSTPQSIEVENYLQDVGDKLAAHAQRKLPYRFLYDPNPNFKSAIGLPGGVVIVGGGILAYTDTEDQLAAVLGHELEHIALNQCRDRLAKVMSEEHITTETLDRLKIDEFSSSYGHDLEREADFEGAKLERAAGYSVNGFIRLLRTFLVLGQQMTNTTGEGQKILQERIDLIKPLLNSAKPDPPERPLRLPPAVS
jgi:beta-barrel assembly-enhancing protease